MVKRIVIHFLILITFLSCAPDSGFGPFNMVITHFRVCSGPKAKSCTILKTNITGDTTIYQNIQVIKTCIPSKGKIVTSSKGRELARFQMNKPCEHLFLRPLLESLFNVTKRCEVLKGDYSREVDIAKIANDYFGGSFFYGNITFRSHLYSDDCNFACTILTVSMMPKK